MQNNCIAHLSPLRHSQYSFVLILMESLCIENNTYGLVFCTQKKMKKCVQKKFSMKHKKARKKSLFCLFEKYFLWLYPAADDELERFEFCRTGIRDGRLPLLFLSHLERGRSEIDIFRGEKKNLFDYYVKFLYA